MQFYLVGGAVRDELLNLPVKDRDWVVVGATPQEMLEAGFKPVGADFPVFLHPETHEEYALARTERKQGRGYHGFEVHSTPDVTLEDDLERRDLTVNAMARSPEGELIDPYGGYADLQARRLRHVSPAFSEDPLRILRTARFAARFAPLGFAVAPDTQRLMQEMVKAGEADYLVAERVWQETKRALHENAPEVYFQVLRDCGALARVLPELDDTLSASHAPLDSLSRARQLTDHTAILYAALTQGMNDEARDQLSERLKVPNDCKQLADLRGKVADRLQRTPNPQAEDILALIDLTDGWRRPERFEQVLQACEATGVSPGLTAQLRKAREVASQVDPQALMAQGFKGKALGEAIQREREKQVARFKLQVARGG